MHTTSKERMAPEVVFSTERVHLNYQLLIQNEVAITLCFSAMFSLFHNVTNKEQLEKHLFIQSSHHGKYREFLFKNMGKSLYYHKSTPWAVSKKGMGHKGGQR